MDRLQVEKIGKNMTITNLDKKDTISLAITEFNELIKDCKNIEQWSNKIREYYNEENNRRF